MNNANKSKSRMIHNKTIRRIAESLEAEFGPVIQKKQDPLEQLIRTILSQQTTSENNRRAFATLRDTFGDWQAVAFAPHEQVAAAIRVAGIANQKAERIQQILHRVKEDFGDYDLSAIESWSDEKILEYLIQLPGVGQKTSRCVLLFALQREALPVDTHVARIARRLGLVPDAAGAEEIAERLHELVPNHLKALYHIHFFELGRRTCKARQPLCGQCCLQPLCPSSIM